MLSMTCCHHHLPYQHYIYNLLHYDYQHCRHNCVCEIGTKPCTWCSFPAGSTWHLLCCIVLYCIVLYYLVSSRLVSSCLVLCRLVLSCLVLHCFILPSSSSLTSVATTITIIINIILSLIAVTTITSLRHHQVTIISEFFVIVIHINII